jgi:hypothetical protein
MHDQVSQGAAGQAPVQAPFEHWSRLLHGKGKERFDFIQQKAGLRTPPSAQAFAWQHLNIEVDKSVWPALAIGRIKVADMPGNGRNRRSDSEVEWRYLNNCVDQSAELIEPIHTSFGGMCILYQIIIDQATQRQFQSRV